MKLITLVLLSLSLSANAAEVISAKLDASKKNILVDVRYGGGCKKHEFSLKVGPACLESFPVQCSADLVETIEGGFDACESIRFETAVISLKKAGLTDSYFDRASLTIYGDVNQTGKRSSANVKLPKI